VATRPVGCKLVPDARGHCQQRPSLPPAHGHRFRISVIADASRPIVRRAPHRSCPAGALHLRYTYTPAYSTEISLLV
jgi:hypothetical protein